MDWKVKIGALMGLLGIGNVHSDAPIVENYPKQSATKVFTPDLTMQKAVKDKKTASITGYIEKFINHDAAKVKTDTVIIDKNNIGQRICLGAYIEQKDTMYLHVLIADTTGASLQLQQTIDRFVKKFSSMQEFYGTMAHELKHRDTEITVQEAGLSEKIGNVITMKADFGPEDIILFNQHNEISARISTILQEREKYIQTGDLNSFSAYMASPYIKAIKDGIFVPGKMSIEQSRLEDLFITKMIFDYWQKAERQNNIFVNKQKLSRWYKFGKKKPTKRNIKLYEKLMDITYSFIKDGQLVNMNYFYTPSMFNENPYRDISLEDIKTAAKDTNLAWKIVGKIGNMKVLCDATPQQEVLDLLPYLQQRETQRFQDIQDKEKQRQIEQTKQFIAQNAHKHQSSLRSADTTPRPTKYKKHFRQSALNNEVQKRSRSRRLG